VNINIRWYFVAASQAHAAQVLADRIANGKPA